MKTRYLFYFLLITASCHHGEKSSGDAPKPVTINGLSRLEDFHFLDDLKKRKAEYLWKNTYDGLDTALFKDSVRTVVDRIDTLHMNGKVIFAIQTESRPPEMSYHTTGALCMIYFFEKESSGGFKFIKSRALSEESPLTVGAYGEFPSTSLIAIGPNRYAYKVEPGFSGQGEINGSIWLFEITDSLEIRKVLAIDEALHASDGVSQGSNTTSWGFETTMDFTDEMNGYYGIRAVKKGDAPTAEADKIINIDSTFFYQYKDGRYELIKTQVNEKDTSSK
jgi:hypothetical protein